MLGFLFRRLTADRPGAAALFDALTAVARRPHWYVEGGVPDTLDGRFAVLATLTALVLVRLERDGEAGDRVSVAVTERFIHVMESEHRELGLGDPTLGRTVRKLVGMLARRTEIWRSAVGGKIDWTDATRDSLHRDEPTAEALAYCETELRAFATRLDTVGLSDLEQGSLG